MKRFGAQFRHCSWHFPKEKVLTFRLTFKQGYPFGICRTPLAVQCHAPHHLCLDFRLTKQLSDHILAFFLCFYWKENKRPIDANAHGQRPLVWCTAVFTTPGA